MAVDTAAVVAGAPVLWPAVDGGGRLHLARAQARRRAEPVLRGVCPDKLDVALERAPASPWWAPWRLRGRWCSDCRAYRDYLREHGET